MRNFADVEFGAVQTCANFADLENIAAKGTFPKQVPPLALQADIAVAKILGAETAISLCFRLKQEVRLFSALPIANADRHEYKVGEIPSFGQNRGRRRLRRSPS